MFNENFVDKLEKKLNEKSETFTVSTNGGTHIAFVNGFNEGRLKRGYKQYLNFQDKPRH